MKRELVKFFVNFSNLKNFKYVRYLLILLNDFFIVNITLYISYFLRIEFFYPFSEIIILFIYTTGIYFILFNFFKINNQFFRFFDTNSFKLYIKFYVIFSILFGLFIFIDKNTYAPRSLTIIYPSLLFIIILINRFLVAKFLKLNFKVNRINSVVFGFNSQYINTLSSYAKVLCIVDRRKKNKKRIINGIEIITPSDFNQKFLNYNFKILLINDDSAFNKSKYRLRDFILKNQILVQKISFRNNEIITKPYFDFNYFFDRKNKITNLGNVYKNKNILITGAGGSIGSNIVFQLLKVKFKKLILIDNSEYNLYNLSNSVNSKNISFHLINFNNKSDIERILSEYTVDIIFHAAAFKHVPLIEQNPFSAIKNNFIDTFEFMKLITKFKVKNFCLISSDKAVRPTNIMGASKRLSELALSYLDNLKSHDTSFCSVRFGNVINSSGSVKPLFQNQIDNSLPLTLTHKKIIRYFMTIEEAANLVLNTTRISKGGEIFLLDMGEPIKLLDLAKLMIQFSGKSIKKNGFGDIEIKIIGLRDGEKLYEELLIDEKSKQSSVKFIYQSLETKISNKNFQEIYSSILYSYKSNNTHFLKKILRSKFINYVSNK